MKPSQLATLCFSLVLANLSNADERLWGVEIGAEEQPLGTLYYLEAPWWVFPDLWQGEGIDYDDDPILTLNCYRRFAGGKIEAAVGYSFLPDLQHKAIAPDLDVYRDGGYTLQATTPDQIHEKQDAYSLEVTYRFALGDRFTMSLGPKHVWVKSQSRIVLQDGLNPDRTVSWEAQDNEFGGVAKIEFTANQRDSEDGQW